MTTITRMKKKLPSKRAMRRRHNARAKAKARKALASWGYNNPDAVQVGRTASTHGAVCSCFLCKGHKKPRRYLTIQERRSHQLEDYRMQDCE